MEIEIPEEWRTRVGGILREPRLGRVLIRRSARQDWADMFPGAFDLELQDALADAVDNPNLRGRSITDMKEPGETYDFIFWHQSRSVYAKICLQRPDSVVIVYSAHRPLKGDKL